MAGAIVSDLRKVRKEMGGSGAVLEIVLSNMVLDRPERMGSTSHLFRHCRGTAFRVLEGSEKMGPEAMTLQPCSCREPGFISQDP